MQNLLLAETAASAFGIVGSTGTICCGVVFAPIFIGLTTIAIEMPIAAIINTNNMGLSEIRLREMGSTG